MTPHKTSQAVVISDLHLNKNNLKTVQLFENFVDQVAQYSKRLFILGDFFEAWIGDDAMEDFEKNIAQKLLDLRRKNTEIFISGQKRGVTDVIRKQLKRRHAIEPHIGHMKMEGKLGRCRLFSDNKKCRSYCLI